MHTHIGLGKYGFFFSMLNTLKTGFQLAYAVNGRRVDIMHAHNQYEKNSLNC